MHETVQSLPFPSSAMTGYIPRSFWNSKLNWNLFCFLPRRDSDQSEKIDQMEGGVEEEDHDRLSATLSSQVYF